MPSDGEPLIVPIVRWVGRILGYLAFVAALPTVVWFYLCEYLCVCASTGVVAQALLVLPRLVVLWGAAPVWLGQSVALSIVMWKFVGVLAAVLVSLSFFGVSLFGLIYSQFDRFLKDSVDFRKFMFGDRHGGYWWNLGQTIVDFFTFLCAVFSVATVIRIPALIVVLVKSRQGTDTVDSHGFHTIKMPKTMLQLRYEVMYCALMVFVDLFTVPFALLLVFVPWRFVGLKHAIEKIVHGDALDLVDSASVRGKVIVAALNGLLDIPCFMTVVFLVLTPWRFWELKLKEKKTVNERRVAVLTQFWWCIVDLFFIFLGILPFLSVYRAVPLMKGITLRGPNINASDRRYMAAVQLGMLLVDIFTVLFCVPIVITVYRVPVLVRKWRKADNSWGFEFRMAEKSYTKTKGQERALMQALYVWRDIPFFFMALCVLVSWRVVFFVRGLWRIDHPLPGAPAVTRKGHERRRLTAHHFGNLLVDIPVFFIAALVTVFLMWRAAIMWYEIKHSTRARERRLAVVRNFLEFFVDLPFALCGLIVTVLLWRAFFMWREVYRMWRPHRQPDAGKWSTRMCLLRHFGMLFVDMIDFPTAFLCVGIVLTGWRLPALVRGLRACTTRNQRRIVVLKEFGLWLLDIPTFLACAIVIITVYRAKTMCKALGRHLSAFFHAAPAPPALPPPPGPAAPAAAPAMPLDEDNPAPESAPTQAVSAGTWHRIVWANFGLLLLDIPFPVLLLLTLWRMPWCIVRIVKECESARDRRITILKYLLLMVKDIPCIILFIPMLITVWRVPSVVSMFKKLERGDNEHKIFLGIFVQWLIDIPFAFMLLWVLVCAWRAFGVIRTITKRCANAKERRVKIAQYFGITFLDILLGLLCALNTVFFPWRLLWLSRKCRKYAREYSDNVFWRHSWSFYIGVLKMTRSGLADLPFVVFGCLMVVFFWRFPFFIRYAFVTKRDENARKRRLITWQYFVICLVDVATFWANVAVILCFWRIHTFVAKMRRKGQRDRTEQAEYERAVEEAVSHNAPLPPEREKAPFDRSFVWYSSVWHTVRDLFMDAPFILMGAFVCICVWRLPRYLWQMTVVTRRADGRMPHVFDKASHTGKHDWYRYAVTWMYFLNSLADIGCAILLTPAFVVAPWRIPSFVALYLSFLRRDPDEFWRHSNSWHISALIICALVIRDWWALFMSLVIVLGGAHVPCLIRGLYEFGKLKRIRDRIVRELNIAHPREDIHRPALFDVPGQADPSVSESTKRIWVKKTEGRMSSEESFVLPLSPSVYYDFIAYEFKHTIAFIPHLFLSPLKLLALVLLPVYLYIKWRLGFVSCKRRAAPAPGAPVAPAGPAVRPGTEEEEYEGAVEAIKTRKSLSFVVFPAFFVQMLTRGDLGVQNIHVVVLTLVISFPFVLWNELGFLPLVINHVLLFVATWFDPLWKSCRRSAGYTYGSPPNAFWTIFELIYSLFQALAVPVLLVIQAFYLVLPIIIFGATEFPGGMPGFVVFWKTFFTRVFWATYVPSIDAWKWAVSAAWWLALFPGWHLTFKHAKLYELFDPVNVYVLLVKRVIAGTIWKGYKAILSRSTMWCFVNRKTCCCVGQWVLMLVFVAWCYWPFVAVIIGRAVWKHWYWLFFFSVPASVLLTWKGYVTVKKYWHAPEVIIREGLDNVDIRGQFPEGGGIVLNIRAEKPSELTIRQAVLKIEGAEFWRLLSELVPGGQKLITTFKILLYPIKLCPDYLSTADFVRGRTEVNTSIRFGTEGRWKIKKKLVLRYARRIVDNGDPEFRLVVEFGDKTFRWVRHGDLCAVTTRMSVVLRCVEHNLPLPIPRRDGTLPPSEPEAPQLPTRVAEVEEDPSVAFTMMGIAPAPSAPAPARHVAHEWSYSPSRNAAPPPPLPPPRMAQQRPTQPASPSASQQQLVPAPPPLELPPSQQSHGSSATEDYSADALKSKHSGLFATALELGFDETLILGALLWMNQNGKAISNDSLLDVLVNPPDEVVAASAAFSH